ncbi:cytochrome c [bacterium]|nr:MAG: cytochrome c [bacterium]
MRLPACQPLAFLVAGVLICCAVLRAQVAAPQTTNFASLDYFNEKCARCHGNYGSFYGPNFAKGKTDEQLAQVVKEMCDGPAQAPISPHDLEILVAWHRALRDGKPFVAAVNFDTGVLSGEASPGSTVSLETTTGEQANVPLNGHKWSAGIPEGVQLARIRVQSYGQTTELDPKTAPYAPK